MCTAATYQSAGFYFGRTLDYEVSYGNQIVITPRNYACAFATRRISRTTTPSSVWDWWQRTIPFTMMR
mgnify:CR=1 FL=1